MNSVFSAFKGNKNDKQKSYNNNSKKICKTQENSYENLRHIREIGSSAKMMTSIVNDDVEEELLNLTKRPIIRATVSSDFDCFTTTDVVDSITTQLDNNIDINNIDIDTIKPPEQFCTSNNSNNINNIYNSHICDNKKNIKLKKELNDKNIIETKNNYIQKTTNSPIKSRCSSSCSNISNSTTSSSTSCDLTTISTTTILTKTINNHIENLPITQLTILNDNHTKPIINGKNRKYNNNGIIEIPITCSNSATTTPKGLRYNNKPRLSLSGFTNSSMPSVHGRTIVNNNTNGQPKQRLSTHQRNLSLDFRSMGILLPPVSQVTNTRINLTQHHRNRSLDSALQRIPEVEVSSPNSENENTFCTNSLLGSTMCSKIVSTTNPQNTPTNICDTTNIIDKSRDTCTRAKQSANVINVNSVIETGSSDNKKREDLTSLGSDDSGIICGSESDQTSLNRIRHSHESLDSGEIDPEEESIEILETTSMDEEYKMLQSDLCFYQNPEKDSKLFKLHRKDKNEKLINNFNEQIKQTIQSKERKFNAIVENNHKSTTNNNEINNLSNTDSIVTVIPSNLTDDNNIKTNDNLNKSINKQDAESKSEHIKNEILFKNFFGATKNAIFRTAQSIIDNHEKKNSKNKNDDTVNDIKSPTEFLKKKEFFVLKSSSKHKLTTSTDITPEIESKIILNNTIENSSYKLKVPGVVKCFIKEKEHQNMVKTEKGPSGLLRFFESPVFNIHFAMHYLFYSKEPGVLSFIGNKIFSFPDDEVDLYIPQLIIMYIQMDELSEVLDPYLTFRCRKSVDFLLKCLWLLEAYNYHRIDILSSTPTTIKKTQLSLMKELYPKKERKQTKILYKNNEILSPNRKTHHRSQSDATGLLNDLKKYPSSGAITLNSKINSIIPTKLCLGDLTSGKAFDNGCICFETVRGTVNDLLGQKTLCSCGAPKMAPQKEFMKSLINIGRNLTTLQTKAEKTSALRMFLNLINKNLPARVWLPLHSNIPHHIVRITEEKTAVLNSKDKTPYIIYVEVIEVDDIYSSPIILKLMPTLRHTKSEEHLESKDNNLSLSSTTNLCLNGNKNCKLSKISISSSTSENGTRNDLNELQFSEDDVWSQEDDEITAQYLNLHKISERDAVSQMSLDSCDSRDQGIPTLFNIGDVRSRHCNNLNCENTKAFCNDPEDPSAAALKEPWHEKEKQIRESSPYGHLSNWRLLSAIVKCGDDLRQELMATQLLQMFKIIWHEENIDLWVRPYKIICLSDDSGLIEPILNTVSLHQIKKNSNKSLCDYFIDEYGDIDSIKFRCAQRNFVQSCAAYCLISYLLQVKDRHNGNILLHSDGHLIHIDFGFILSISPKNLGFEQSPFKLTPEFVEVMGGTSSELWIEFNHLLLKGLMAARKHMDRIINIVEIMRSNAQLPCFKNGCSGTVQNLRKRFHMNLTEQELERKVEQLVQDSLKSLSTKLYDGYQYFTNGIL